MIGVDSQCVAISTGASLNMPASVSSLSTSMLPVEAPMKILMPAAAPAGSERMTSRLSLVAPR